MEKKLILAMIDYAQECEQRGDFAASDSALAVVTASLNSSMKKIAAGGLSYEAPLNPLRWDSRNVQDRQRTPNYLQTLQQTFLEPAAVSAGQEFMQGDMGQNLGMLANIYGPAMMSGNLDPSSFHIPGTKTSEEGEDTDSDWQPWRTPGSTDERMTNYMNQQQGKTKLMTDIITRLGDWARRFTSRGLGLQTGP